MNARYPSMGTITPAAHTAVVREIFTVSSARYDFMNHFLSLRRDVGWRSCAVEQMRLDRVNGAGRLLDVATGTGDLAIAAALRYPGARVTGIDFAGPMLEIGRRKVRGLGLSGRIELLEGDALSLPFPDASFDVCSIAFGMRNIPDKRQALREMARVTVPGGRVMVLEMTFAPTRAFRPLYGFYLKRVLPTLGAPLRAPRRHLLRTWRIPSGISLSPTVSRHHAGERLRAGVPPRLTFGSAFLHIGRTKAAGGRSARHGATEWNWHGSSRPLRRRWRTWTPAPRADAPGCRASQAGAAARASLPESSSTLSTCPASGSGRRSSS